MNSNTSYTDEAIKSNANWAYGWVQEKFEMESLRAKHLVDKLKSVYKIEYDSVPLEEKEYSDNEKEFSDNENDTQKAEKATQDKAENVSYRDTQEKDNKSVSESITDSHSNNNPNSSEKVLASLEQALSKHKTQAALFRDKLN